MQQATKLVLSSLLGLLIGFAAGLVGVGGGELRIPVLLFVFNIPVKEMILVNLLIGLAVVVTSFTLRFQTGLITSQGLLLAGAMFLASLPGALLGSVFAHRLPDRQLKGFLAALLVIVAVRLLLEPFIHLPIEAPKLEPALELVSAGVFGFFIGIISGAIGVAGGEYRIPVLVLFFAQPIKVAGTASQLVSIPTVATAFAQHWRTRPLQRAELTLAFSMATGSVVGVVLSIGVLVRAAEEVLRLAFGLVLLYTVLQLLVDVVTTKPRQHARVT